MVSTGDERTARDAMDTDAIRIARELGPLIRQLRGETEAGRRIADPIVERLRDTRLCRMTLPDELGGLGLTVPDTLEVFEVLAAAEASVAWIAWNNQLPWFLSRFLDRAVRKELFGDPGWLYAVSTRPSGRASVDGDGFRIEGRWSLVSGCELAEWIALLCNVEEGGRPRLLAPGLPESRAVFLRRGEFEILDTWYVGG